MEAACTVDLGDTDRLARAQDLLAREGLPALLEAAREGDATLADRFRHPETQGRAQARLQAAVADITADLEFRNRASSPARASRPTTPRALWRVHAQISGVHEPGSELWS